MPAFKAALQATVNKARSHFSAKETLPPLARSAAKPAPSVRPVPAAAVRPVQPSPPPRIALEDDDECLADAYLSGVSIEEMADELGMHPAEIRHRLREMDLMF